MKKLLALFCIPLLVSCTNENENMDKNENEDPPYHLEFDKELYEKNRKLWESSNFKNYAFSQKSFSESFGPSPRVRVIVKNSVLDTVFVQEEGYPDDYGASGAEYFETISKCYDFIGNLAENLKEDPSGMSRDARISVKYDDQYHYPKEIDCASSFRKPMPGGLDIQITIDDFELHQQ